VWGTAVYTDDSAVCPALVHAGVLPESGGVASITFMRGLRAYVGSESHGVKSSSYGKWARSFYGQALGPEGKAVTAAPQLPLDAVSVDCSHAGRVAGTERGESLTILCPPGCAGQYHALWGSNPYTSDSRVCAAAIHAGVIPPEGGRVVVTLSDGQATYVGSTKNGIESHKYGQFGLSFTVSAVK